LKLKAIEKSLVFFPINVQGQKVIHFMNAFGTIWENRKIMKFLLSSGLFLILGHDSACSEKNERKK